jgi:hypothetical protein
MNFAAPEVKRHKVTSAIVVLCVSLLMSSICRPVLAATVTLVTGHRITGKTIVREDIVTVLIPRSDNEVGIFQYPLHKVMRIEANNPATHGIVETPGVIRQEPEEAGTALPDVPSLEKGLELRRLTDLGEWTQVEYPNFPDSQGYVPSELLDDSVEFSFEERAEARERLKWSEIPPPSYLIGRSRGGPASATSSDDLIPWATEETKLEPSSNVQNTTESKDAEIETERPFEQIED